jgi:site-specific DNA-methyltransferase (adenine-specific)
MNNIIHGDSLVEMGDLEKEEFHAVVTDPPYNYKDGFMQKEWDDIGSASQYQEWCEEWGAEALRVLKPGGHIISFCSERMHHRLMVAFENVGFEIRHTIPWIYGSGMPKSSKIDRWLDDKYKEKYGDWRGLLKPAIEFAILARKPVEKSASKNQMKHGTGNLNIEACRIEGEKPKRNISKDGNADSLNYGEDSFQKTSGMADGTSKEGRYPANLILDSVMADVINGMSPSSDIDGEELGASRFFYCTKASKSERTHNGQVDNEHNTVKPLDLMRWLVRLVTAEEQKILDPFAGSGTTLIAAEKENRRWIGIEREKEYISIIKSRLSSIDTKEVIEGSEKHKDKTESVFDY